MPDGHFLSVEGEYPFHGLLGGHDDLRDVHVRELFVPSRDLCVHEVGHANLWLARSSSILPMFGRKQRGHDHDHVHVQSVLSHRRFAPVD